eukprot:5188558-Pyramimonas_sp.AAC.1
MHRRCIGDAARSSDPICSDPVWEASIYPLGSAMSLTPSAAPQASLSRAPAKAPWASGPCRSSRGGGGKVASSARW